MDSGALSELTLSSYQYKALSTAIYPQEKGIGFLYCTLKLCGESGEIAQKVGKIIRDKNGKFSEEDKSNLADEVGDVLWYVANLSHLLGVDLGVVAERNLTKLADRKARGVLGGSGDKR